MILSGKRILLGISGGIAAYKMPDLVRFLQKRGAEVRCLATRNAARLVSPAALSALTRHPVELDIFGDEGAVYTRHIDLAQWADAYLVAPLTAQTAFRLAHGAADDPVAMAWLCVQGPRIACPSMNMRMLAAPATQRNLETLRQDGAVVLTPDCGDLACGETGPGRLPDHEAICAALEQALADATAAPAPALTESVDLASPARDAGRAPLPRRLLVTMGRTEEPIDAVRVITNRSSGATGARVAAAALARGHQVTVVAGPCEARVPDGCRVVRVRTALEMHAAATSLWAEHDWAVCAAAVADFRPKIAENGKIPASRGLASIELEPNPDILAELCQARRPGQKVVGFALETAGLGRGAEKLARKGVDGAVLNDPTRLSPAGRDGFGEAPNWAWIGVPAANHAPEGEWMDKGEIARRIVALLEAG